MGLGHKRKVLIAIISLVVGGLMLIWQGLRGEINFSPRETFQPSPTAFLEESTESTASAVLGAGAQRVKVVHVVDGDTIEIETGQKVRYIGIDTPETVDPRRPVGCFGREASAENKRLVDGKTVYLVKDISETDKFGRLLRYVYLKLDDGSYLFVNDYLVRAGFAKASTYPPDVKYVAQFLEAEKSAREKGLGLWQKCT